MELLDLGVSFVGINIIKHQKEEDANGRQRSALRVQLPEMPDSGDGHSSGSRTARLGGRLDIDTSQSMVMSVLLARVEACRRPGAQRMTPRRTTDTTNAHRRASV